MIQPRASFRSVCFLSTIGAATALTLNTLLAVSAPAATPTQTALKNSPKAVVDEAWQIVNQTYVDRQFNRVNWQKVRQELLSKSYPNQQAAYAALKSSLKLLNDPYTRFLDPKEFQALNSEDIDGELTGVGLQLEVNPQSKTIQVVKALDGSPALKAGIQTQDQILAIDGRSTQGMSIETAASLIRGRENTPIQLKISRAQQPTFTLNLTRQKLTLPVVYSAVRQQGNQRIGYIRLSEFSGHSAEQMKGAIAKLNNQVDRFVLDLRGNPGGRLDQETEIARMWLNQGTIVRIVDRDGNSESIKADGTALTNRPLTVLVDGNSASASEILTGALKDNHRATVVGTQTFGKALVQSVNPLSDGSGVNVTIAHYFTPSGLDINHKGISPDVVVELNEQQQQALANHPDQLGTSQDPQYARAVNGV